MHADEVALAIAAAAREGWNPGLHDARTFPVADPDGFLIAEVEGGFAGCISAVSCAGRFGFIGLYIVQPAFRGRGIGWQLWTQGMARLQGQVVGLDGVPAQQDNYRKSGFVLAWRNARYAGRLGRVATKTPHVLPLTELGFGQLASDDARVFPAPREDFLRAWIAQPDAAALGWLEDGVLRGWGVIRRCMEGWKIGPLNADAPSVAEGLFDALCARAGEGDTGEGDAGEGDAVFLDVPLPNASAVALAEAHGMRVVFETARMYKGPPPACELQRVFGITTFELG
ncbi:GNAT family N-acetyltransferase [Uliginosibacterium sp. H1]|uniref:GNAT family N-acetyltransferase n=1 Tax=Uliginosibacterium sp. H1 TaxID=3114757 RepID=UPI002E183DF6|nr:GNAT family N-acetyltransferase [Uliginosibacterium sp. H1]